MKTSKTLSGLPAWDFRNVHVAFKIVVSYLLLIESMEL